MVVCGEGGLGAHHVVGARTPRADGGVPARRADGAVRAELIGIATELFDHTLDLLMNSTIVQFH